jgi:hypothetical protein
MGAEALTAWLAMSATTITQGCVWSHGPAPAPVPIVPVTTMYERAGTWPNLVTVTSRGWLMSHAA